MVTNNFKENFNFITNILILTILVMGGISYGDTNGLWTFATDIRGGVFGADEQGVTNNFTFINPVYFNSQLNSTNVSNLNKVIVNDITGKTGVFSKDLNLTTTVSSQNSLLKISSLNAFSAIDFYNGTSNKWGLGKDPQNGFYIDQFGVANSFYINTIGNVGIGTKTPSANLGVNGSFKANSANITTSLDANSITATNLVATNINATNSLNLGGNPVATQNDVNTLRQQVENITLNQILITGNDAGNQRIVNISNPVGAKDVVNKQYLQSCSINFRYAHPSKTCSNSVGDTCTTPVVNSTQNKITGSVSSVQVSGCSKGYWSGYSFCNGNAVNGVCPISPKTLGTFDSGGLRVSGLHESYLFCYADNVREYYFSCP